MRFCTFNVVIHDKKALGSEALLSFRDIDDLTDFLRVTFRNINNEGIFLEIFQIFDDEEENEDKNER